MKYFDEEIFLCISGKPALIKSLAYTLESRERNPDLGNGVI